jgi:two-component system sensor histidine kinase and response regulator WspE
MLDLFRVEVETQMAILSRGLVDLESQPGSPALLKDLMRAAHSMKGAARIVNVEPAVRISHAMEDCLVAVQEGKLVLDPQHIDALLCGVDLITAMAKVPETELGTWEDQNKDSLQQCIADLAATAQVAPATAPTTASMQQPVDQPATKDPAETPVEPESSATTQPPNREAEPEPNPSAEITDRALRITAENLNRLLGLAGESLLATRWLETFATELLRLKRHQQGLAHALQKVDEASATASDSPDLAAKISEARHHSELTENYLNARIDEFDLFQRVFTGVSNRLYQVVLDCRMRPFRDVAHGLSRMVRDVARGLGKEARLQTLGLATPIDRDVLDRLEAPLSHLLRNALDHGLESPADREAAGKPRQGTLTLEARHSAGTLLVEVSDDGRGIDVEKLRATVVERQFASAEVAAAMSDAELLEFIYLPSFSIKTTVTEISGRGVGLDAVQSMAREVGGEVRVTSQLGAGTKFQLRLPLTRSVLRTLIVDIAGELYALPLAKLHSATKLTREQIESSEGRQHFQHHGQRVGLVMAHQVLGLDYNGNGAAQFPVIVLEERGHLFGLLVDQLVEERELVVLPLDKRLGKVPNISAAALLPDRSPILILDANDIVRSIENLVSGERLHTLMRSGQTAKKTRRKRVLVVDDSLTVRELERKLLTGGGYDVEAAVDGLDGWNAVRTGGYDLVITDVDMPRMDGIELVNLIRKDARFKSLPLIIVSYKDRPEDRDRGLEAGADYYLTKASFQDETLLRVVHDLVGDAVA